MVDAYGVLFPNEQLPRWDRIQLPFYGYISLGNYSMFQVLIIKIAPTTTNLSIVGARLLVAVERVGAFGFSLGSSGWLSWNYVSEKLGLAEKDARNFADLLNALRGTLAEGPEQGSYERLYPLSAPSTNAY